MSNQYRCAKYNLKLDSRTRLDIIISAFLIKSFQHFILILDQPPRHMTIFVSNHFLQF